MMKTRMKLVTLLGALALALWLGAPRQAFAYASCESLNGQPCSPGTTTPCTTYDGWNSSCSCGVGNRWLCAL
jgi:hypothetical protein